MGGAVKACLKVALTYRNASNRSLERYVEIPEISHTEPPHTRFEEWIPLEDDPACLKENWLSFVDKVMNCGNGG